MATGDAGPRASARGGDSTPHDARGRAGAKRRARRPLARRVAADSMAASCARRRRDRRLPGVAEARAGTAAAAGAAAARSRRRPAARTNAEGRAGAQPDSATGSSQPGSQGKETPQEAKRAPRAAVGAPQARGPHGTGNEARGTGQEARGTRQEEIGTASRAARGRRHLAAGCLCISHAARARLSAGIDPGPARVRPVTPRCRLGGICPV